MNNDEKIANINIKLKSFFYKWVEFTRPFHKLSNQQQKVLALLLYHHYRLAKEITNNKILWKSVFDYDTKLLINEELGIQPGALENLLSQLRKRNVIMEGQVSPVYIPKLSRKAKQFRIIFNFNIIHE
jgi:hypothetical protein